MPLSSNAGGADLNGVQAPLAGRGRRDRGGNVSVAGVIVAKATGARQRSGTVAATNQWDSILSGFEPVDGCAYEQSRWCGLE